MEEILLFCGPLAKFINKLVKIVPLYPNGNIVLVYEQKKSRSRFQYF